MLPRVSFWDLTKLGKKIVRLKEGSESRRKVVSPACSMKLTIYMYKMFLHKAIRSSNLYPTAKFLGNIWILNVFRRPECNIEDNVPSKRSKLQSPLEDTRKMCYQPVLSELGAQKSFPL